MRGPHRGFGLGGDGPAVRYRPEISPLGSVGDGDGAPGSDAWHALSALPGGYVGIRPDGRLVAMAGRRLHPDGWIEVSAVCTDPAHRGSGLARRVTAAVVTGIQAEGARPFLHVLEANPGATAV